MSSSPAEFLKCKTELDGDGAGLVTASFLTFHETVAAELLLNLGLPFELTVRSTSHLYMTKADAVPQGSYKLSPSDSIPSSEHAGPDVGWCVCARVCVYGGGYQEEEEMWGPGRGQDTGRKWTTCGSEEKQHRQKEKEHGFSKKADLGKQIKRDNHR